MAGVQLRVVGDSFGIGTWRNVVLSLWRRDIPVGPLRQLSSILGEACTAHPEGVAVIVRLTDELPVPESDGRDLLVGMMQAHAKSILVWCIVVEGIGFRAATARTAASTLRLLARASFPLKIASSVSEAAPWIATRLSDGAPLAAGELLKALDELDARVPRPAHIEGA